MLSDFRGISKSNIFSHKIACWVTSKGELEFESGRTIKNAMMHSWNNFFGD